MVFLDRLIEAERIRPSPPWTAVVRRENPYTATGPARGMGLWEVAMRASYDYPFIELSRTLPETPLSMWCLWDRELLQVARASPKVLEMVERGIRKSGRVIQEWTDARSSRIFLLEDTCERYKNSPWNLMSAHQCWDAPPVVYRDGWANFRVISFEGRRTQELYDDLRHRGSAELLRKRELSIGVLPTSVWTNVLFGDLTAKQAEAMLAAYRHGYYTSPRPVTTEEIAGAMGVGRTTYEEHLRKAENRVISSLIPYLELYATADRPAERMPLRETPLSSGTGHPPSAERAS